MHGIRTTRGSWDHKALRPNHYRGVIKHKTEGRRSATGADGGNPAIDSTRLIPGNERQLHYSHEVQIGDKSHAGI